MSLIFFVLLFQKTLFDGLEEYDPSIEVFSLKPNPKRLVLTNKSSNNSIDNIDKTLGNESLSKTSNIEDTKVTTTPVSGLHGILLKDKKGKEERRVSWFVNKIICILRAVVTKIITFY